eukprot:400058_1
MGCCGSKTINPQHKASILETFRALAQTEEETPKEETPRQTSLIEKIDNGLKEYYKSMGRTDYADDEGVGGFKQHVQHRGYDDDNIVQNLLDSNPTELIFDFSFPLRSPTTHVDNQDKKAATILTHIAIYGLDMNWKYISNAIKHELNKNIASSFMKMITKKK